MLVLGILPLLMLSETFSYTRRFFGGRHPLCGMGVTSVMLVTRNPLLCKARTADSRPGPGPFTRTSRFFIPKSLTISATRPAATCAANGVLFLEPRKPLPPAVAQASAFPCRSVTVIMVLLKDAWMCATPSLMSRRTRLFLVVCLAITSEFSETICGLDVGVPYGSERLCWSVALARAESDDAEYLDNYPSPSTA